MLFQPWSQPSSSPSPPSLCPPINFKVKKKCDLVVQQELHVLKDVISMGTCDKQMLMKMTEDVPTFSCLFLFFQARKVSKVIRVTSAPRAARCRDRDRHQDEQSTDSVQGYISHMEYLRSSSHQASLALCGGNIWGSNLAASHVYLSNHKSSILTSFSISSSSEISSSFSSFFLSFFSTKPGGRACRYIQTSAPPGHTQNQPYLLFSMASRKYLHTCGRHDTTGKTMWVREERKQGKTDSILC